MKFGKEFRTHLEETLPEWRDKFLCYKPLKKLLKRYPNATLIALEHAYANRYVGNRIQPPLEDNVPSSGVGGSDASAGPSGSRDLRVERNVSMVEFQEWFVRLLNEELDKFNDFYMEKEEDFVIRFQELKERIEEVKEKRRGEVSSSEGDFTAEMMDIRMEFVTIHGEMVLLKNYSSLNFAGLVKILKKYDKRTGGLLRLPFTQLALHQPFFTTEPLTRLVRECEANLDLLFPLEEEVTESASAFPPLPSRSNQPEAARDHPPLRDMTNVSSGTTAISSSSSVMPPLGEAIMDIYRNTVSAMRTIEGLRMSSTYNPLSFATLFRNQEEEGSGAVTAENSAQQGSDDDDDNDNVDAVEKKDDSDDGNSAP